jgi:hypothetical protein
MMPGPGREVDIRDYRVFPSMDPKRLGRRDVLITYFVGAEGPFTVTIPYEELEGKAETLQLEVVKKWISAEQAERLRFLGKKLTL